MSGNNSPQPLDLPLAYMFETAEADGFSWSDLAQCDGECDGWI